MPETLEFRSRSAKAVHTSEGFRRVAILLSTPVAVIAAVMLAAHFASPHNDWLVFAGVCFVLAVLIYLFVRSVGWVVNGFRGDEIGH